MGGAEWLRNVGHRISGREPERVFPNVSVKKNRAGVLLPSSDAVVEEATRMVKSQYLAWAAGQPGRDERLDRLIADDVVPALSPRTIPLPGNPDFVVFFPSKKGVSLDEIADTLGGEVGLSGIDVAVSYPGQSRRVCEDAAMLILSGVKKAMLIPDREGLVGVSVAFGEDHTLISLGPRRSPKEWQVLPAFGQERQGIISFAEELEGAYRHPVQFDRRGYLKT